MSAWTPPRVSLFTRLWRAGLPTAHVGVALGIAPGTVNQVACRLRRQGHDIPRRHGGPPTWTPERVARAARAMRDGVDRAGLAAAMGVAPGSVRTTLAALRRAGHDLGAH